MNNINNDLIKSLPDLIENYLLKHMEDTFP